MKQNLFHGFSENIKADLPASIVVFFVSAPMCLGIAHSSGAPLFSGIIAGIIGGMVVTAFSGSILGVSGPAAGLAVIVFSAIEEIGFEAFQVAVVLAGLIQIGLCYLRAGFIAYYFPSSVIKGMMSAIGILVVVKQIPHAFGYKTERSLGFFQDKGYVNYEGFLHLSDQFTPSVFMIWILSMAVLFLWKKPFFKSKPIFLWIQGPLVVVVMGSVLAKLLEMIAPSMALSKKYFVNLPVSSDLSQFFGQFSLFNPAHLFDFDVYQVALTLGLVASIQTLLCIEATDKLDPKKRVTPLNQELKAQGIGNICSGMIGGIPVTQTILRVSANIQSGARTRLSAFLHGTFILLCAFLTPDLLNTIPLASLAAILMMIGYKLAQPILFKEVLNLGWYQSAPFFVTIIVIVTSNLLLGILSGLAMSLVVILWENYKLSHFIFVQEDDGTYIIKLPDQVSFLSKAHIRKALEQMPADSRVVIDGSEAQYIDYDVWEIIENFKEESQTKGIELLTEGVAWEKTS